ncbi:MAG: ABC transporter ATP-binding protein [Nitrososphaerota archaeon]|nr:ABC transporter ATP-binding protein [Nitrososphaerota archaeon]
MQGSAGSLLEVDHVSKSFKGLLAINDLSFFMNNGEILGLIGPNGAGKTTAFNLISGTYKPDKGEVRLLGDKISGKKPYQISRLGISRTFQIVKPFARLTVLENILTGALFGTEHHLTIGGARSTALEALRYVGLEGKTEALAGELTLAEQRRLELARTIASKPRILMLDEIMAGLNQTEISDTMTLLKKLNKENGITLLVIEHVMSAIMQLCDRVIVMDHGVKLAEGTPTEVVNNLQVVEAYMGRGSAKRKAPDRQQVS